MITITPKTSTQIVLIGLILVSLFVVLTGASIPNLSLKGPTFTPSSSSTQAMKATQTGSPSATPTSIPITYTPILTSTAVVSATPSQTASVTATVTLTETATVTATGTETPTPVGIPFLGAPACIHPDNNTYHGLWNAALGCHYDHEHGDTPFTSAVAAAFPGFDLRLLIGGVEIGHTNPSGPMENTMKHGGFKWNVQLAHPQGCAGFEGSTNGVNGSAIEYHDFGDYAVELEAQVHSTASLLRLCNTSNPTDYGYLYTVQFQDYGEKCIPYQGTHAAYPVDSVPPYDCSFGQYLSVDCIDLTTPHVIQCRDSLAQATSNNAQSNWTSKITGTGARPVSSTLFRLLFRIRDIYQLFDWDDQSYPYTFMWLCSSDAGATYNPVSCHYNNSTSQVHEISGIIPTSWDNLAGFDTDARVGRITAEGFTTRFGNLNPACASAGPDCHPIKMVGAFVGSYGSVLIFTNGKGTNIVPIQPERDIYFCGGTVCSEDAAGAVPSGWIGGNN